MKLFSLFSSMTPFWIMIISSIFAFLGDYFAKLFSVEMSTRILIISLIFFIIGDICFIATLFKKDFVLMNMIRNLLNISLGLVIGFILFKEQVTTIQGVGIALSILGIILMSIE